MKTANITKCVCVWQDETDADGKWIVSKDEIDLATNETAYTATVSIHDDEESAKEAGMALGQKAKLPVYLFESTSDGYARGNRHTLIS